MPATDKTSAERVDEPIGLESLAAAETWVFDLDNTLYPASSNLFAQVDVRIRDFIAALLGLPEDEAYRLQKQLFREHGTTLRGLMTRHGVDPGEFMDFVHDIDVTPIDPSPDLDAALARLPGRKVIFTNASANHARRVTERLGVTRHFDAVFDIEDAGYVPKPHGQPYARLIERHRIEPRTAVMVEDIARNLHPAAALGFTTVWVRTELAWAADGAEEDHVHHVAEDLADWLRRLF
jgi:putative hydrolase of the HAD superfamily